MHRTPKFMKPKMGQCLGIFYSIGLPVREAQPMDFLYKAFLADCENQIQAMLVLSCTTAANLCFSLAFMQQRTIPNALALIPAAVGVIGTDLFLARVLSLKTTV